MSISLGLPEEAHTLDVHAISVSTIFRCRSISCMNSNNFTDTSLVQINTSACCQALDGILL